MCPVCKQIYQLQPKANQGQNRSAWQKGLLLESRYELSSKQDLDTFVTNDLGEAIVINHAPLPAGTVVLDTVADGIDSQHGMTASYEVVCSTNGQIARDPSDILAALAGLQF